MGNKIELYGTVMSSFRFDHVCHGKNFYASLIAVKRESGVYDYLPIMGDEEIASVTEWEGKRVYINGSIRTFSEYGVKNSKLLIYIHIRQIELLQDDVNDDNCVTLDGYFCKLPVYRKTPLGREIADLILAVNRPFGKSDYIPCICWGRHARYVAVLKVGEHVLVRGRIQSRKYIKKLSEMEVEKRTAYEVSISEMEVTKDGKEN